MLLQHVIGFVGVLTNLALSLSPFSTIREARGNGSLGGMDTSPWPLLYGSNLFWTCYSFLIGDIWLFGACGPAAMMWLFFCLTAIRLLAQEEGETLDVSGGAWDAVLFSHSKTIDLKQLSKKYRLNCIKNLEMGVMIWTTAGIVATFCCSPWDMKGLEAWETIFDAETRIFVMMILCGLLSLRLFSGPAARVWSIMKLRDASTVFVPLVCAMLVSTSLWCGYGLVTGNVSLYVPNGIGGFFCILQIVLRCIFGAPAANASKSSSKKESEITTAKVVKVLKGGKKTGRSNLVSISEAGDAGASDGASTRGDALSELYPHRAVQRNNFNTETAMVVEDTSIAAEDSPARTSSLPNLTNRRQGQGIYEAFLRQIGSGKEAGASDGASTSMAGGDAVSEISKNNTSTNTLPVVEEDSSLAAEERPAKVSSLPDLTNILKEQGIYEDYLNWQRDYRRWRQGGLRGANGEVKDKVGEQRQNPLLSADISGSSNDNNHNNTNNKNNNHNNKELEGQLIGAVLELDFFEV
ncbi:unnamed protein product [Polarella glacialis]|uniref:Uncharacterized protein n=1 Tax=Polarella glacialis TaxID=89957 RepID=A0A813E2L0_POLGL|nr:unnamed protein product [Polarella glacialis]